LAEKGVLLVNMGGPSSLEEVEPFLKNLFSDPYIFPLPFRGLLAPLIARLRAKKVKAYYEAIGGGSPQLYQTLRQQRALKKLLGPSYEVAVGMRYSPPFIKDALNELLKAGVKKLLFLPLYPQYSTATTGSAYAELKRHLPKEVELKAVEEFHDHPLFIQSWVERIRESLPEGEAYLLFSAHGLPKKLIKRGDPYQQQVERTAYLIAKHFPHLPWSVSYQSKVGFGEWLGPSTEEAIKKLAREGVKTLVVVPVSFVSEHVETLYELDLQMAELARKEGIERFIRVPTPQDHPLFIQCLRDLVLKHLP